MTKTTATPFNIKLEPDDRERLERIRIDLGLRSHADAVRALIRGWAGPAQNPPRLSDHLHHAPTRRKATAPLLAIKPGAKLKDPT